MNQQTAVPIASPAHECLRSKTHSLHRLIDSRFDLAAISSVDGYTRLLLATWPLASIEPALEDAGIRRLLPDWERRRRRDALADDLSRLAVSPPAIGRLAVDSDPGTLLGWSYVLEGSRLGARMILRAIETSGSPRIMDATSFLRHGADARFWESYKAVLSEIDRDPVAIQNACAGATAAFRCFLDVTS